MKLKNKLFIILFVLFILLCLNNNSFASENEIVLNNNIVLNDDLCSYPYITVMVETKTAYNYKFYIFYSNSYFNITRISDYEFEISKINENENIYYKSVLTHSGGINSIGNEEIIENTYTFKPVNGGLMESDINFIVHSSDCDVVDTSGNVLFQAPPQVIQEKSLEEVVQESHLVAKEITQETLTAELVELVPVGVGILATIILVSLIAYWNFWKP